MASNSSQGGDFTYLWGTTDGNIVNGENTLMPTVDQDGTYTLTVTNTTNGCTAQSDVIITINQDAPISTIEDPGIITCTGYRTDPRCHQLLPRRRL